MLREELYTKRCDSHFSSNLNSESLNDMAFSDEDFTRSFALQDLSNYRDVNDPLIMQIMMLQNEHLKKRAFDKDDSKSFKLRSLKERPFHKY